ncbi:MAG: DMT family transporter [Desulfuromonadales bacterium]|nr:DMT family transporter [Desulfuromonadales bacterium]
MITAPVQRTRTILATLLALLAFAANSLLCRMALSPGTGGSEPAATSAIDAASFTSVRLICGALTLLLLVILRERRLPTGGGWGSSALLFLYASTFSFAYLKLPTGTGALLLFGAVQLTMLCAALRSGERPRRAEWSGLFLCAGGLVWLVLPGISTPPLGSTALMLIAGIAWGIYSLRGRVATRPLHETTGNFLRSIPLTLVFSLLFFSQGQLSPTGLLLAALSGALASGVGYAVWYVALGGLTAARAALIQLAVPVLAACGGVLVLAEDVTPRLVVASALILGGIGLAVHRKEQ